MKRSGAKRNHRQEAGWRVSLVESRSNDTVLDSYDYTHHRLLTLLTSASSVRSRRRVPRNLDMDRAQSTILLFILNFLRPTRINATLSFFLSSSSFFFSLAPISTVRIFPLLSFLLRGLLLGLLHLNSPCITSVKHFRSLRTHARNRVDRLSPSHTQAGRQAGTHARTRTRTHDRSS